MAMTFNISKYIVALAVVSMTVASCSREEDHIWEQSAAERLDAARSADLEILCAATNGWEMLYFTESDFRGVNFLLKFADNGSVTVATRNADTGNAYQEETSAYDVITDDGPVLSFNTYNSLLHRYADPDPDQTQQTDGVGEGGDYEFKIMSISSDLIYLRGKKHGVDIYMYPLEAGADWQQYFADVYANHEKMFDTSIPQLWLTLADGKRFSISNATVQVYDPSSPTPVDASRSYVTDQVMAFVPEGGDALTETKNMSYIVTRKGIRWMQAFPGDTLTTTPAREFVWNDEGTYLVSTDFGGDDCTAGATIKAPALADFFVQSGTVWRIDPNDLGGRFASAWRAVDEGLKAAHANWSLNYMQFSYYASASSFSLLVRNATSNCRYYCTVSSDADNSVKFDFQGNGDNNGETVLERVPALQDFLDLLNSTRFDVSATSEILPLHLKFASSTNADDYFYVDLQ